MRLQDQTTSYHAARTPLLDLRRSYNAGIMSPKRFTLIEARAALATIRPLLEEILAIRSQILARRPELWPATERTAGNGGSAELSRLAKEFDRLDQLVHKILDSGVEIKDLGAGLIDFRARRQEHDVYLCWKYGEHDILSWHEIEAGFSGRQPIESF